MCDLFPVIRPKTKKRKGKGERMAAPTGVSPKFDAGHMKFNKNKKLSNTCQGEKFLFISRTDEKKDLSTISPFFLKKCIDGIAGGEVKSAKKTRDGRVLVHTKNLSQAKKLVQLVQMANEIHVEVKEDEKMNQSKGVVYSRDFRFSDDDEILEELKSQNVIAIYRVKKRSGESNGQDTGIYFLTFNTNVLPQQIRCGYEMIDVRPYIPEPLQCFRCLQFGHPQKACKMREEEGRLCGTCTEKEHTDRSKFEKCQNTPKCVHCGSTEHGSFFKKCNKYIIEKEIIAIKTIKHIPYGQARLEFMKSHPLNQRSFASITKTQATENLKGNLIPPPRKPPNINGFVTTGNLVTTAQPSPTGGKKNKPGASSNSTPVDQMNSDEDTEERRKRNNQSPPIIDPPKKTKGHIK